MKKLLLILTVGLVGGAAQGAPGISRSMFPPYESNTLDTNNAQGWAGFASYLVNNRTPSEACLLSGCSLPNVVTKLRCDDVAPQYRDECREVRQRLIVLTAWCTGVKERRARGELWSSYADEREVQQRLNAMKEAARK